MQMKKLILKVLVIASLSIIMLNINHYVLSANKLKEIQQSSMIQNDSTEFQKFKKEAQERIQKNKEAIAEFKAKMLKEKKEAKAQYKERINELEQKNNKLKDRIADYKEDGKEKWESFKNEFNHDMDEVGKALKDLGNDNKK